MSLYIINLFYYDRIRQISISVGFFYGELAKFNIVNSAIAHKELEQNAPAKPADETQADRDFETAVKAFDAGDYTSATAKFHDAMQLSPGDIVMPFAHAQVLFAGGQYQKAAEALCDALLKSSPEQEGVFYPRGLYSDESVLNKQIEQLSRAVEKDPVNARLRLLLGYQLLGIGRLDEANGHLENARLNSHTNLAATLLIDVLEKNFKSRDNNTDSKGKTTSNSAKKDIDLPALAMAANEWLAEQ